MIRRISYQNFKDLVNSGGVYGIMLLIRPLIYILFSRRRDLDAYSSIDTSAMVFILYAVICFVLACHELNKGKSILGRYIIVKSPNVWFVIYTLLGAASIIWSVNPLLSAFRSFECLSMLFLIVAVIQRLFSTGNIKTVIDWSILYVTIDILFSIIRVSSYATDIFQFLEASQMMATTFFFLALYYIPKRWFHYLIIIMSLFSMSTVAYIGMALGCISTFWYKSKYRTGVIIAATCVVVVIAIIGPYTFVKSTVFFDKKSISIHETTGRDKVMFVALKSLEDKPQGLGFFAGEPYLLYAKNLRAINGHNSFFSAAIGLGYLGVVLIAIFFLGMFKTTFSRYIPSEYKAAFIGCLCVAFLHCMGNPGIGSRVFGSWLPVTFLFTLICGFYVYEKYFNEEE